MEMTCFSSPDAVGHAYILSSPSREDALRKAREIASAVVFSAFSLVIRSICTTFAAAITKLISIE